MTHSEFPYRQVHLDFHTSEHLTNIGSAFDPHEFAQTLQAAHVNSITCFARCHHGWMYYYSQKHPDRQHPHLQTDLLRQQIEACHAVGIRVPIYTTVQWDHASADRHPEWLAIDDQGKVIGTPPFEAGFYRRLCLNSPYREFLKEHTREILETLPTDGLFFDIVSIVPCACKHCRERMQSIGLDPSKHDDRMKHGLLTIIEFKREMSALVRSYNPDCSIFYNDGHIGTRDRSSAAAYSHWELESLPSGGWGYLHFPISQRYARTLGHECIGMTGKFHSSWGDSHSFKNLAALEYECFRMLALGAKCSVGDQLHPLGQLDPYVYSLIGNVYSRIEQYEPYCIGSTALNDIGVLSPEEYSPLDGARMPQPTMGIERMLDEAGHQFDIIDSQADFSHYRVIILPDTIPVDSTLAAKLAQYSAQGGGIIASFESGLSPDQHRFALSLLGVELVGDGPRDLQGELVRGKNYWTNDYCEYLRPRPEAQLPIRATDHVMHMRGLHIHAETGSKVLADTVASYFDRTYQHFSSHRQTPSSGQISHAAIVQRGRSIYFAHPIFSQYAQNAATWCKHLFLAALARLLPDPLLSHNGPSTLFASLREQKAQNRKILHLLHYIPERRGLDFDVIEDIIPLHDLQITIRQNNTVQRVVNIIDGHDVAFETHNSTLTISVPKLHGYQLIAIEYA
jgi:hypothetical protein